jgi:hypothetical protein
MNMVSQHWRSQLVEALNRQSLPSAYVDRLVEELSDHASDLFMENPSMEAQQNVATRLGTPEQLAAVAKAEFQRRTFAGRHPVVTFVAGPIVAVIGTFVANALLVIAALLLVEEAMGGSFLKHERNTSAFAFDVGVLQVLNCCIRFVPFALPAWFFVRLGRRSELRAWTMTACGIVAVAALFLSAVVNPGTAKGEGTWIIDPTWRIGFDQIVQAAVPLAFGMWMLWRSSVSRSKSFAT